MRDASRALAAREERAAAAEASAAQHALREAALAATEAQIASLHSAAEAAKTAAEQRQAQLDELYERVKADAQQLRDQAEGFERRRAHVITDVQVHCAAGKAGCCPNAHAPAGSLHDGACGACAWN